MADQSFKVLKVLNNNTIVVEGENIGEEQVLTGKGLGFGTVAGTRVTLSPDKIEKYYIAFEEKLQRAYLKMIEDIDKPVLEVCSEIILMAEERLGKLNSRLHLVLTDHVSFAIERLKMQMEIHNPFLSEIKMLYKEEYRIGEEARNLIEKRLKIHFNDDEVGFIALHFYSASQNMEVKDTLKHTRLIKELIQLIEAELGVEIDNDLTYSRLVSHLKGALERSAQKVQIENPLLNMMQTEFKASYDIAMKLREKIQAELGIETPDEELGYMTIHIDRIRRVTVKSGMSR